MALILWVFDDDVLFYFICSRLLTCLFSFLLSLRHQPDFPLSHTASLSELSSVPWHLPPLILQSHYMPPFNSRHLTAVWVGASNRKTFQNFRKAALYWFLKVFFKGFARALWKLGLKSLHMYEKLPSAMFHIREINKTNCKRSHFLPIIPVRCITITSIFPVFIGIYQVLCTAM